MFINLSELYVKFIARIDLTVIAGLIYMFARLIKLFKTVFKFEPRDETYYLQEDLPKTFGTHIRNKNVT